MSFRPVPLLVLERGATSLRTKLDPDVPGAGERAPLLSCLMVTRRRARLARRAIRCFQEQTYPEKELVIVDDDDDDTLARHVAALSDPRIVSVRLPSGDTPLGALRNLAVERAGGAFVCQWDDDDLSHVRRLEIEMAALTALGGDACFLACHRLLWLDKRRLGTSFQRVWEGAMICAKGRLPPYPALRRGEDTPVVERVVADCRVVLLDAPELYTYVFHGTNTFEAAHFERFWQGARRYEGAEYALQMSEMLRGLPADVARELEAEMRALPPDDDRGPPPAARLRWLVGKLRRLAGGS